jgi:hypothetical protein
MEKTTLREIAYQYYPKKVNSLSQKELYINTSEFKKLESVINRFKRERTPKFFFEIKESLQNNFSVDLIDITAFEHFDRSHCFQLINKNSVLVNVYISFIVPCYAIKKNPNAVYNKNWDRIISHHIEEKLNFTKFSNILEDEIIEDISFQDIKEGEFTFFNAFFSD